MTTRNWISKAVCTPMIGVALNLAPPVSPAAAAQEPAGTAAPRATAQTAAVPPGGATAASGAEERIADLETQLRILARQIELDKEQAAERARQTPQTTAGRGGFSIASAHGSFRLRLRGLLHSDGRVSLKDADNRVIDGFLLRRVRPIVESTIYRQFDFRIMPDFGNGTTVLQDAYVDARFTPSLKVRAGKFKAPVGIERLVSAAELTFIERALPTLLAPNRDVGVMLHGDVAGGNLSYAVGLFNGVVDGGSADLDLLQDGKDGVARIFVQPLRTRRDSFWQGLGAGVAVSHGPRQGVSAAASGLPTFRSSGGQAFFAYRGDDPLIGAVLASGAHTRISPQGHYYYGRLGLLAEYVLSSQRVSRGASVQTLRHTAWQFGGSWVLTGETPSYRGVSPRAAFDPGAGSWGAFELTARYASLAIDADTFPVFANPATAGGAVAWAGGLNWILHQGVKVQVNYEHTRFAGAGASRRPAEHDLLTRLQLAF